MASSLRATVVLPWCAAVFFAGCAPQEAPPPPPPQVVVDLPAQRDVTNFAEFTGNTQAIESVEIRARVQGFLQKVAFEPATFARKGQLLFVIEQEPFIVAKDRAEAEVASSEAALRRTESDLDRLEQAVKTNAVSQQEVTRARAERDQARAAQLSAEAVRDRANIDLGYTEIRSPIGGIISRHLVDPGNLVGRNEATHLADVLNIDPIYVYFEVNEQLIAQFLETRGGILSNPRKEGSEEYPVYVSVDGVDRVFEGYLDYIDPETDPDTGTIQVRAKLPNGEGRLLPGFFVHIRIPGQVMEGALLVQETALSTDLGGRFVMIVGDDGIVDKRYVEPGALQDDGMRLALEGIAADERYIVQGLQRARPGMPVTLQSADDVAGR